jgi:hypothetical protein
MVMGPGLPVLDDRQPSLVAVVDANVFAQTTLLDLIIAAAKNGRVTIIWSPLIITEVSRLLTWRWIKRHGDELSEWARRQCSVDLKRWYEQVAVHFHVVEDRPPLEPMWTDVPRDPWDQPVWTAAVRTKAIFPGSVVLVITSNLRDGPPVDQDGLRRFQEITFVSPDEAIQIIEAVAQVESRGSSPGLGQQPSQVPERFLPVLASIVAKIEALGMRPDSPQESE